jgi:hypothetical protein
MISVRQTANFLFFPARLILGTAGGGCKKVGPRASANSHLERAEQVPSRHGFPRPSLLRRSNLVVADDQNLTSVAQNLSGCRLG